mgnify:CR=1 FL=1
MDIPNAKSIRSKCKRCLLYLYVGVCIGLALATSPAVAGGPLTVTHAADDENPGSLRSAINAANAQAGADVITFADGLGPIVLNGTQLPTISESVSIIGPPGRQVISGNQQTRIFSAEGIEVDLVLENLRLIDGRGDGFFGGGGAVLVDGPLTVRNCIFSGNSTNGDLDKGGAIANSQFNAPTLIEDSLFENNRTIGNRSSGGAIDTRGALTIRNSTFRNNQTEGFDSSGGAISAQGTIFEMFDSVVEGNSVLGTVSRGGGIRTVETPDNSIVNSVVRGNTVAGSNGAIWVNPVSNSPGSLVLRDSTVSGNRAAFRAGIYTIDTEVTIINSTISGNLNLGSSIPAAVFVLREPIRIENSTIVGNVSGSGTTAVLALQDSGLVHTVTSSIITANAPDESQGVFSESGTLDITDSVIDVNTQINGVDSANLRAQTANLGPLADNGCSQPAGFPAQAICVPTHALLGGNWPGSNPGALTFDQRGAGFPRQMGDVVEAGSVELELDQLFGNGFEVIAHPE